MWIWCAKKNTTFTFMPFPGRGRGALPGPERGGLPEPGPAGWPLTDQTARRVTDLIVAGMTAP